MRNEKSFWIKELIVEFIGSFLIALGLYNFALYAQFPMTGFSGIALILYRLFGLPIGLTTILLNLPVAVLCYRMLGRGFFLRSLRCMVICSVMVDYVAPLLPVYEGDRLLAAICTGVIGGFGYAMIYMYNSSTGGSDFIVMAIKSVRPHISLGNIAFWSDVGVILLGGIIFRDVDGIVYGMIINYIFAIVVDKVMCGLNRGKVALIVTEHGEAVADAIDVCCQRGTTIFKAVGGYKKEQKEVVLCAYSVRETYLIERTAKRVDAKSFMIVMDASEVLGEGFRVRRVAERKDAYGECRDSE